MTYFANIDLQIIEILLTPGSSKFTVFYCFRRSLHILHVHVLLELQVEVMQGKQYDDVESLKKDYSYIYRGYHSIEESSTPTNSNEFQVC